MHIKKPSVTKIDRVNLLHSASCRLNSTNLEKPGQILVSLLRYAPFHDSHQEDSCFQTEINNCIKPRSISKQLCMWLVEVVNANKQLSV